MRDNYTAAPIHSHNMLPIFLACLGYAVFTIGDTLIKTLTASYHYAQVVFMTSVCLFSITIITGGLLSGRAAFRTQKPWLHAFRGILFLIGYALNIYALKHLPLSTFYAFIFTFPIWSAILASYLLKDHIDARRWIAIIAGFCTVLYMMSPTEAVAHPAMLAALTSGFLLALSFNLVRGMGQSESRYLFVLSEACFAIVFSTPLMLMNFIAPTTTHALISICIAVCVLIGMQSLTAAFQKASSAATVASFHYSQMIWGAILGYLFFQEIPTVTTVTGSALLTVIGLFLIYDEYRKSNPAKTST